MQQEKRFKKWFSAWWKEWAALTGVGLLLLFIFLAPFGLAFFNNDSGRCKGSAGQGGIKSANVPAIPSVPANKASIDEMTAIVASLLPLYKLPDGQSMPMPVVNVEDFGTCRPDGHIGAYSTGRLIVVCDKITNYPRDRLERVLKHEMIHVWLRAQNIKDDSSHGSAFMRKALEVHTFVLDE